MIIPHIPEIELPEKMEYVAVAPVEVPNVGPKQPPGIFSDWIGPTVFLIIFIIFLRMRFQLYLDQKKVIMKCDPCKDGKHDWCDRTMKGSSKCNCLNITCSSLNNDRYHSP